MTVYVLKRGLKSKMDTEAYVSQYSLGVTYTQLKGAVKFFRKHEAEEAKKMILREFHVKVIVQPQEYNTKRIN